ncbi:MAG: DNA recombination protein RmuC [Candidatus Zapsychrus exili]|nr:DNA recombination protein RmuC [Candidatus Zapsychrus exili]
MNNLIFILIAISLFNIVAAIVIVLVVKKQMEDKFALEQQKSVTELETRKQAVDGTVVSLKEQLDKYEKLIREFEQDRDKKYGNLENELKNASQNTSKLQETTNKLNDILGNVKLRGQWGERMAEDIIRNAGLIEGINYRKQKQLEHSTTKPDYTFLLPDEHIVNMDVKFPLDNYLKMVNTEVIGEKERFEKEFKKNVKERIKEIQDREYINPAENTLDFVLLFIPNEQVFGIIQEKMPELMDESLKQKVVLCSPFTLYAMLSVIRQAYENFRFEKDLKKIIGHINLFMKYYGNFKTRFEGIGDKIKKLDESYQDVKNKNFKSIDTKIRHIEECKSGNGLISNDSEDVIDVAEDLDE